MGQERLSVAPNPCSQPTLYWQWGCSDHFLGKAEVLVLAAAKW